MHKKRRTRVPHGKCLAFLVLFLAVSSGTAWGQQRLLIAFSSFRDEPLHPTVFFYEHDGRNTGKITGKVEPAQNRSDHHPALSRDGKLCAFAAEIVSTVCTIHCWHLDEGQLKRFTAVNTSPRAQMAPTIGGPGIIGFEAWNRPGSPGRWDLLLVRAEDETFIESPNLNTSEFDERKPALSGNGRWLAFTTNAKSQQQLSDISLYDREAEQRIELPGLNSHFMDTEPAISHDGRWIAFVSDRPGGPGARDVHLYDRRAEQLIKLPGLNSVGQEQSPSISPDGRYIAFVSERLEGTGERDVYVYDRESERLLPLPGLNSVRDEYDPCVIAWEVEE